MIGCHVASAYETSSPTTPGAHQKEQFHTRQEGSRWCSVRSGAVKGLAERDVQGLNSTSGKFYSLLSDGD